MYFLKAFRAAFNSAVWLLPLFCEFGCTSGSAVTPLVDEDATIIMDLGVKNGSVMGAAAVFTREEEVRYYVFDGTSGRLENVVSATGEQSVKIGIRPGKKQVWAVSGLDFSRFDSCSDIDSFTSQKILLEDNSLQGTCPMSGNAPVYAYTEDMADLDIDMRHYAARISVTEIRNALAAPLAGEQIRIRTVFLTNVISACTTDGGRPDDIEWYNVGGYSSKNELIGRSVDKVCPYGETLVPEATFLFFPNDGQDLVTRLVVEAMIGEGKYYYPVDLTDVKRSHSYNLVLEITRPGSSDPDSMDFGMAGGLSLEVQDFEDDGDEIMITF